jgi:hypothetical protein
MGWVRVLAFEEERPIAMYTRPDERNGGDPSREEEHKGTASERQAGPPAAAKGETGEDSPPRPAPESLFGESAPRADAYPGTGWGRRRHDPVREVRFEPVAAAADHLALRYEYWSGLQALGIFTGRDRLSERERGECRFALPPER